MSSLGISECVFCRKQSVHKHDGTWGLGQNLNPKIPRRIGNMMLPCPATISLLTTQFL